MKVYLAGFKTIEKHYNKPTEDIYLLSSFWEHKTGKFGEYVFQEKHILDSGAFTVINDKTGKYKNYDWDTYLKKYIEFIKLTKQKLFFELDIDIAIGYEKVKYYRSKIEDAIGIAPIVCWHLNRGSDEWIKSCENYSYVALGLTNKTNLGRKARKNPYILNWFIKHARNNNVKIHGLGYTQMNYLDKLKFDSVDSTSWLWARLGYSYYITPDYKLKMYSGVKNGQRINNIQSLHIHNFEQWIKYQKYAEENL